MFPLEPGVHADAASQRAAAVAAMDSSGEGRRMDFRTEGIEGLNSREGESVNFDMDSGDVDMVFGRTTGWSEVNAAKLPDCQM